MPSTTTATRPETTNDPALTRKWLAELPAATPEEIERQTRHLLALADSK